MTRLLFEPLPLEIHTVTMISQYLSIAFKKAQILVKITLQLLLYVWNFELVFTKENFHILLDHKSYHIL